MDKNRIKFEYNGVKYVLQYTRDSVTEIEDELGFDITKAQGKLVSSAVKLFRGAFIANHPTVSQNIELMDEIFDSLKNKQELFKVLTELYIESYNSLFEEPKDDGKNATWERVK